jgi:hypothetical protein
MNSVKASKEVNPEPSQGYILGRCRDYLRGKALLITGISVQQLLTELKI